MSLEEKFCNLSISEKNLFKKIVDKNEYVKKSKKNKQKDKNSLCFIIKRTLSQSENIRMGTAMEKIISDIINNTSSLKNIKSKNSKGIKEKDHLWSDDNNKIIYYAEFKSNINLDTEKTKSTIEKIINIEKELVEKFKEYKICSFLVALRYYKSSLIPKDMKRKYKDLDYKLVGVNDYLHKLGSCFQFLSSDDYSEKLGYLADAMYT